MTSGTRVLIIEDNRNLAAGVASALKIEGYQVDIAGDGEAGLLQAQYGKPAAIVLDLMLPKLDGYEVLRTLRRRGNATPVLILTAGGSEREKLRGFRYGADDYVVKPFSILELVARLGVLIRRSAASGQSTTSPATDHDRVGDIEIHQNSRTVLRGGIPVPLRPKEYELLVALVRGRGAVISRTDLLAQVWGMSPDVVTRTVDIHVAELRRKLEADPARPRRILTVRKIGYRVAP